MMRHHSSGHQSDQIEEMSSSSSDDEEEADAFAAFSRKKRKSASSGDKTTTKTTTDDNTNDDRAAKKKSREHQDDDKKKQGGSFSSTTIIGTSTNTSSNRRHHNVSDTRQAKMDAILLELHQQAEEQQPHHQRRQQQQRHQHQHRNNNNNRHRGGYEEGGSFVEPGDEHLTTNIFVGNLAPSITEEDLTELFRQFGDLYSIKIMWPRSNEARSRDRHTGFVCFVNRKDAEEALEAVRETDPFNVGRRLHMGWGKNVKKSSFGGGAPIVKKGTGWQGRSNLTSRSMENHRAAAALSTSDVSSSTTVIRVLPPQDKQRLDFISEIASYVSTDGSQLENILIQRDSHTPEFQFLTPPAANATDEQKQEHIYYKWRVFSFCHGDTMHRWRTEPFRMFQPEGCTWIPPPMDLDAARIEEEATNRREEDLKRQKQQRRLQGAKRSLTTGAQFEQARRGGADSGAQLTRDELDEFERLFRHQLCCSREAICHAMAFCFEKSGAARHVSTMLRNLLMDMKPSVSVDTLMARIFVISDVLFNSQQPGIRNAFIYRDAVEKMSPEVFTALGNFSRQAFGRMSRERLASAVKGVLAAWANWGVYEALFLDELECLFEGREFVVKKMAETEEDEAVDPVNTESKPHPEQSVFTDGIQGPARMAKGDWTRVRDDAEKLGPPKVETSEETSQLRAVFSSSGSPEVDRTDGNKKADADDTLLDDVDGEALAADADGRPLDDDADADGKPLDEIADTDGKPLDDDAEDNVEGDDPDGEPLEDDLSGQIVEHPDGQHLQ